MSSSRARTRIAAIAAAIPVLAASGPLVSPASAVDPYTVTNLLADGQTLAPNAGYLGLGVGVSGSTAMFKVTPPHKDATISGVELTLTQLDSPGTFVYQNEFDTTDGLALYADVNDNGQFDAADKATGMRSNGYRSGRVEANGDIPFLVSLSAPTSGANAYFLALHPAATATTGRRFAFRVDIGNIVGNGGSGPVAVVTTPLSGDTDRRITIDATPPAEPPRTAFTPTSNPPGTEDEYTVVAGVAGTDSSARIAFYNSSSSSATSALLTRPGFDPATPVVDQLDKVAFTSAVNPADPAAPRVVKIGDGTGIVKYATPPVLIAKNNQDSNAVYARLIDAVGNVSPPAHLTDCYQPPNGSCETTKRGNPVVAPDPPTAAALQGATGINAANEAAVPVRVTTASTAVLTTRTDADTKGLPEKVAVRIAQKAPGGYDPDFTTATKEKTYGTGANVFVDDVFDTRLVANAPRGIQQGNAIAYVVATNLDRARNPSLPKESSAYAKDIVAPTVTISAAKAPPAKGDLVEVQFSEAMTKTHIAERKPNATTGLCDDYEGADSVEKVLDVKDSAGTAERTWGRANCFAWASDSRATITLGEARTVVANPPTTIALGGLNDRVKIGTAGSIITDLVGNPLVGSGTAPDFTTIVTPPPAAVSAVTKDANFDGVLDGVVVTFATEMSLASIRDSLSKFAAFGPTTVPITSVSFDGNEYTVLFSFTSNFGGGETPQLRLLLPAGDTSTGVVDKTGRPVPPFSVTAVDKAAPQPKRIVTLDVDPAKPTEVKDGKISYLVLHYSEPIQHARDNNADAAHPNKLSPAYHVPGRAPAAPTGGNEGRNVVSPLTGNGSTKLITLAGTAPAAPDSGSTAFSVKATRYEDPLDGNKLYAPIDLAGNRWAITGGVNTSFTIPSTDTPGVVEDGAAPVYLSRHTRDLDGDGRVDAIDVRFSENIPTAASGASFTVTGHQIVDQYSLGTDGIRIVIDETAPDGGDTAVTPTMQHNGGVTDTRGNAMSPDSAAVTTTDGAGPAIMGACPSSPKGSNGTCPEDDPSVTTDDGAKMNVFFSEPLDTSSVAAADFVVEQPAGATPAKAITGVIATNTADGKYAQATLSFAAGTLSNTVDSVVRFSAANVITDNATVKVGNTQTANVTALAPPVVNLALSCPTQANPGYCGSTTINTGATGSTAVTKWRLKNTARGTVIDPADYSSTRPDTITLVEGPHDLYLSGLDVYGRLSPEIKQSITILAPPRILNLQFQNATTRGANTFPKESTLLDGDTLHIGADAYGTDAADWAEDGQPTDGGCLVQHMAINLKPLTGRTSDDSVAPFSCDLNTVTEQPHRAMRFPVVKATRTTRYPVGTVLKISDSDPGWLIVDGSNGSIARRRFVSANARRSWMISDASVIRVPTALVSAISRLKDIGYRDGAILRGGPTGYYYVENGVKRPVSTTRLRAWRIPTTVAYRPTSTELRLIPTGSTIGGANHPAGTWIKFSNGKIYQVVRNGSGRLVRRPLGSTAALRTLVPTSQIYAANSYDLKIPADSWIRGYRDGTILVWRDSAGRIVKTGVISRGSLRVFANALVFNTLGFNASNGLKPNASAMPRVSGQAYRTGAVVDRYSLGEVVMKVTNLAGASVTAEVPNGDGFYGLGTFDPIPAGWDMTR